MYGQECLEHWKAKLHISDWVIVFQPIDEMQVVDDLKGFEPGHEFVGIERDFNSRTGIIYHTRPLVEDDIIHELLHVRYPDWNEEKVEFWTSLLFGEPVLERECAMEYLLPTG
jgi:hypothetical protein